MRQERQTFGTAEVARCVLRRSHGSHAPNDRVHAYSMTRMTYYYDPMTLAAGQMLFTDPAHTPLQMPDGEYAVTYFVGDVVYADTQEPVPLSES